MRYGQWQLVFLNFILVVYGAGCLAAAKRAATPALFVWVLATALLIIAGYGVYRARRFTWLAAAGVFFLLGWLRYGAAATLPATDIARKIGTEMTVTGIVRAAPAEFVSADGTRRRRYEVAVTQISGGETVTGNIYVSQIERTDKGGKKLPYEAANIGDRVSARGVLREVRGYRNSGRIDAAYQARVKGITARLTARGEMTLAATPPDELTRGEKFHRQLAKLRAHYAAALRAALSPSDAAAVFAMLFGGYQGLKPELVEAFTATGIVHILSVSGSHMTLLAGLVLVCANFCRASRRTAFFCLLAVLGLYSLLAGLAPPVVRSALLSLAGFGAFVLGRRGDAGRLLSLVGLVLLLWEPLWLFDISFQLSFLSTLGLIYVVPKLVGDETPAENRGWRGVKTALAATLGVHLLTLPAVAWYFNSLSLASFAANIVVVPLVDIIIAATLPVGLLGLVAPPLMQVVFALAGLVLGVVYELAKILAALPLATVYVPAFGTAAIAVYYALIILWLGPVEWRDLLCGALTARQRRWGLGGAAVIFAAALIFSQRPAEEMQVHFIDVGQGDAALVVTPHGKAFLLDTGGTRDDGFDVGERVVAPYLKHYGVRELAYIFLSHAHRDHAGGAAGVCRNFPVGTLVTGAESDEVYAEALGLSPAEQKNIRRVVAAAGAEIVLDGVKIAVLHAPRPAGKSADGNELSNVYRVSYGRASFLFTGDLTGGEAEKLSAAVPPDELRSTVLKVAHHGAAASSPANFIRSVAPRYGVISVGGGNPFGHPGAATLGRLTGAGAKIFRTDRDGAIVFSTDGEKIRVATYAEKIRGLF